MERFRKVSDKGDDKIKNIFDLIQDGTLRFTDNGEATRKTELEKSMVRHPSGRKRVKIEDLGEKFKKDLNEIIDRLEERLGREPTEEEVYYFIYGDEETQNTIWNKR
ncbi:hypothetical protein HWD32_gp65 [Gordonia phage Secretariat]|uniref:Uncharacterized protein n=1 Tax=Gordonia phage Secretariat TaxID=2725616 RepID=A0A6M3SWV3_9CAUD|nr:hypothetical protein HWD32_gp65 [Gordonia phage Secretariat]QJD49640.1 hypothetical protein SEA_SECRETARIAT_65 [Gordonia phage Secretariat]